MSRRVAGVLALVLLATACAGRAFTRPSVEGFVVGKSTEAEIRQRFGSPYRESTVVKNNETMKTLAYAYATTMTSAPGGVVPARGQGFYFWGDVLVGHDFTSSFPEDRTDFDGAKATQIKKGETTEAGVEAVLGKPHGTYVYPLINDKTTRGAVYLYQQTRGTAFDLKIYQQILVVQYDTAGVVKEVEYTAAGER